MMLAEMGCDAAQGYFFAPAMPATELEEWIQRVGQRTLWRAAA